MVTHRCHAPPLVTICASVGLALANGGCASSDHIADSRRGASLVRAVASEFGAAQVTDSTDLANAWGFPNAEERRQTAEREDRWAATLERVDGAALAGQQEWRLYGVLREAVEATRTLRVCHGDLWSVDQLGGWHAAMFEVAASASVNTAERRTKLLASFRALDVVADRQIADLQRGVRLGYTAPRSIVDRVIAQLDGLLAEPVERSPLLSIAGGDSIPQFRQEWTTVIRGTVYPAVRRYRDFLVNEYRLRARTTSGLAALPDGTACYRAQVRGLTTLDIAPESLYALGVAGRRSVDGRLRPLVARVFGTSDLVEAKRRARSNPRFVYASPDSALAAYGRVLARSMAALPRWFENAPTARLLVRPVPATEAASAAPARYQAGPDDESAPSILFVNAYKPGGLALMNVALGAVHEGYPGHHFQRLYGLRSAKSDSALRWLNNSGYVEGWAIYCEALADEMGVYATDIDRLGALIHLGDVFMALEVDAGLHGLGWSREQAVDTMMIQAGRPRAEAESYADRDAASPGQLASYGVGYTEIRRLRDLAEQRLGSRFSIKAFHTQVLEDGAITLPMLRAKVMSWLADDPHGVTLHHGR